MHLTINQALEAISGQSLPVAPAAATSIVEDAGASVPALDPVL